jgi:hypothetical protein
METIRTNSQSLQDIFAMSIQGDRTYLEIGANHPSIHSNTYQLEVNAGWRGVSIEYNTDLMPDWKNQNKRKQPICFGDALIFDYDTVLTQYGFPKHLTYLSCDIDPPKHTFTALKRILNQGFSFDCITYEHDLYCTDRNYDLMSRKLLESHGYKVAVYGVFPFGKPQDHFETWYVRKDIDITPCHFLEYVKRLCENFNVEKVG